MQKEQFYNLLDNPGLLNNETVIGLKELAEEFPYFQVAWMLYLKNLKETNDPEFERVLKKVAIHVPDRKRLYKFLNSKFQNESNSTSFENSEMAIPAFQFEDEGELKQGNSLIDKFLSSNPGIIKKRTEDSGEPSNSIENDIVMKSDSESDEIITETLAMIYFQQKKYEKALEAFRKLSLKYPKKSVYFATRIEEIEKIMNV